MHLSEDSPGPNNLCYDFEPPLLDVGRRNGKQRKRGCDRQRSGFYTYICAHAANPLTRYAAQSTASLVAHLKADQQALWATGTSAPCTGIFKPVWFEGEVIPDIGPTPNGRYDPASLWWHHEKLHRLVLADFSHRLGAYRQDRDELEQRFLADASKTRSGERWQVSQTAFKHGWEATHKWIAQVQELPVQKRPKAYYRYFWQRQNKKAGLAIPL